jgi:hypothetical protein
MSPARTTPPSGLQELLCRAAGDEEVHHDLLQHRDLAAAPCWCRFSLVLVPVA